MRYRAWGRMVCGCDISTDAEKGLGATKRDACHDLRGGLAVRKIAEWVKW